MLVNTAGQTESRFYQFASICAVGAGRGQNARPGRTGSQHEADVNVTDDRGRKKAGLRRILKNAVLVIIIIDAMYRRVS